MQMYFSLQREAEMYLLKLGSDTTYQMQTVLKPFGNSASLSPLHVTTHFLNFKLHLALLRYMMRVHRREKSVWCGSLVESDVAGSHDGRDSTCCCPVKIQNISFAWQSTQLQQFAVWKHAEQAPPPPAHARCFSGWNSCLPVYAETRHVLILETQQLFENSNTEVKGIFNNISSSARNLLESVSH